MHTIKKSSPASILALLILFASCDQGATPISNEKIDQVELEPEVALNKFGDSYNEIEHLFKNLTEYVRVNEMKNKIQIKKSLSQ